MRICNSLSMIWICNIVIISVFSNCEAYNGTESEINKIAQSIKKEFENQLFIYKLEWIYF